MKCRLLICLLSATGLLFLAGCTGLDVLEPRADSTRFYILEPPFDEELLQERDPAAPSLHLGTGTLAKHLQDSRIAIRTPGSNEITYANQHRWAEPLADGIARVLVTRIAHQLGSSRVAFQRFAAGSESDYVFGFHIHDLGGKPAQAVRLHASWWIQAKEAKEPVLHETLLEESLPPGDTSHAAYVKGLQQLVEAWAGEISAAADPGKGS
jgi:uncharacterized lipoprotein YmbA